MSHNTVEQGFQQLDLEDLVRNNVRRLCCHHMVRIAAVATCIATARHLYADGFHYPILMLLTQVSIALLCESLIARDDRRGAERRLDCWTSRSWQAAFAISVAFGLLCTYQSLLHVRNVTLGVMILSFDWAKILEHTRERPCCGRQRSLDASLCISTFLLCVALMLWNDHWLVPKGFRYLLAATTCTAIARTIWRAGLVDDSFHIGAVHMGTYVSGLAVCLLVTCILATTHWYNGRDFHVRGRIPWILANTMAGVLSLCSDTSLKKLTWPIHGIQGKVKYYMPFDVDFGSTAFSLLVVAAVEADNESWQYRPLIMSGVQWLAFVIAHLATVDVSSLALFVASAREKTSYLRLPEFETQHDTPPTNRSSISEDMEGLYPRGDEDVSESAWLRHMSRVWQATLSSLTWLLVVYCVVATPAVEPGRLYGDLDIVVAWHDEPVEQVIRTVQLALDLPNMSELKARTIVYNKGSLNETELRSKFPTQSELVIRRLENFGREGETYISHLIGDEQDFARHTLFIQADPHEPAYLQSRLRDYFVEDTGFLSLSYVRNFCQSCDRCNDHSGWSEDGAVVRDMFQRSNPDQQCRDISLTYRGQFVVSSQRMKQVNRQLLHALRDKLIGDDHIGYTLERFWGIIFQCPTISEQCPTLLSGWLGNVADTADCQCLDPI